MLTKCMGWTAAALVAACMGMTASASAQMGSTSEAPKAGDKANPSMVYNKLLNIMEKEIVGAAEAMPADKFDFAPSKDFFKAGSTVQFDTVRSFGAQVAHVAGSNYYFFGVGQGKPPVDPDEIEKLTKKDDVVKALKESFAYAHKSVDGFTADNVFLYETFGKGTATRGGMATFGLAHMNDHYGQMVVYLRMNGIVPPASRK